MLLKLVTDNSEEIRKVKDLGAENSEVLSKINALLNGRNRALSCMGRRSVP